MPNISTRALAGGEHAEDRATVYNLTGRKKKMIKRSLS